MFYPASVSNLYLNANEIVPECKWKENVKWKPGILVVRVVVGSRRSESKTPSAGSLPDCFLI
eukprot:2587263-Rhodomonas_salina.1